MATALDQISDQPNGPSLGSVVRRRGETREQMQMRHDGFSDEQTGFGVRSPLARSYNRASTSSDSALERAKLREAGTQGRFDERMSLQERQQMLKEDEFALQSKIQQTALEDKKAALAQMGGYLAEEDALAQKFGRNSREFLAGVLSAAKNYPAAVMADPRMGAKLNHYQETYEAYGGHPDAPTALWEAAQFDPASLPADQARQYLGEVSAKYPGVANDKAFSGLLGEKLKQVAVMESRAAARIAGLAPKQIDIKEEGGNVTMEAPVAVDKAMLTGLEKDRTLAVNQFTKARAARQRAGVILEAAIKSGDETAKSAAQDLVKAADDDILEWQTKKDEAESQLVANRSGAKQAASPAAPAAAPVSQFKEGEIRVKDGINYKRDANGTWHPLN